MTVKRCDALAFVVGNQYKNIAHSHIWVRNELEHRGEVRKH